MRRGRARGREHLWLVIDFNLMETMAVVRQAFFNL